MKYKHFMHMGLALLLFVVCGAARAEELTIDFELPSYSTGALNGQDGWTASSSIEITDLLAYSGTQGLLLDRPGASDAARRSIGPFANASVVSAETWVYYAADTVGARFDVMLKNDSVDVVGARFEWDGADVTVAANDGSIWTDTGSVLPYEAWTKINFQINFEAGTYDIEVGGSPIASGVSLANTESEIDSVEFAAVDSFGLGDYMAMDELVLNSIPLSQITWSHIRLGVDVSSDVAGAITTDEDLITAGSETTGLLLEGLTAGIPAKAEIDALIVDGSNIVLSLDVTCEIDGTVYEDEDLIAYDADSQTFSIYLDGSAVGIDPAADLDAACFEWGTTHLLLSFETTTELPGNVIAADNDVVMLSNGTFSIAYDGEADLGLPESADIDALYDDGSDLYFSLKESATIGEWFGSDNDVWTKPADSHVLRTLSGGILDEAVDLVCLDQPLDSDGDWLTDWEELSGQDEPSTTFPGTSTALDPEGIVTDPTLADTDGDGVDDGIEAACGTDGTDDLDYLYIASANTIASTNHVITWRSASSRVYALDQTSDLMAGFTNVAAGSIHAASGEDFTTYTNTTEDVSAFYRVRLVP